MRPLFEHKPLNSLGLAKEMATSPLYAQVFAIAGPVVVELILTALTQMVDIIMVGRLGAHAISAVGITNQPRFIMLATFVALNVGTTALVARFKGQGNKKDAELVTGQTVMISLSLGLLLSLLGVVFARPMVRIIGAGPDILDEASAYFRILMIGFIPTALPISISALLRGVGDTKLAMKYNITANLVNIVFNYLLIYGKFGFPRMEVQGAALATVIGHMVACAMALWAILGHPFRKPGKAASEFIELNITRRNFLPDLPMLSRIFKIGLPSAVEQFVLRLGLILYTITITSLGTSTFAAHQIVLSILNMSFVNGQAFGIAATSLTGQSLGRSRPDRARRASAACQKAGALISTFMGVLMFIFRKPLVMLFSSEPEILLLGAGIMIFAAIIQPFQSSFQVYAGALRGAGDSLFPAITLGIGILGIRPLFSYIFIQQFGMGLYGAWSALVIDQVFRFFIIQLRYRQGRWVSIQV
ncbi:MAG: MATE family efflux transporter [Spirochaetia bacterium]|nr:MATE family efflux transporter [Spirochaetales bacterium]MDX9783146.1 MATE family efflux transporter [Spirochaetia bacterium]